MAWRNRRNSTLLKIFVAAILCCCLVTILLGSSSIPSSFKRIEIEGKLLPVTNVDEIPHRLAVVVPFRNRFDELLIFAPFIHRFLNHQQIQHDIVIVNQVDKYRFNRASLINVGFQYVTNEEREVPCDYIAMHDVDLLPLNKDLPYNYPQPNTVTHVAAPGLHPKYNYSSFIGGILIVPSTVFRTVDGMSNVYWGWGLEDDEFYVRLKQNKIQVVRPNGIHTGMTSTFRHIHNPNRPRDYTKCYDQYNKTRRRDRVTGLSNVNYTLQSISHLKIEEATVTVLNVQLHCNTQVSPWCDCTSIKRVPKNNSANNSSKTNSDSPNGGSQNKKLKGSKSKRGIPKSGKG